MSSAFTALLDELADVVAARVIERLQAGAPGMVDQSTSPLGRRRHCAIVRQRLAHGEPGAAIVGRRHLLSPQALSEALERATGRPVAAPTAKAGGVRAELERELRLVRGGGQ